MYNVYTFGHKKLLRNVVMVRQLLRLFAVTLAFGMGAAATGILLEIEIVRSNLGFAADAGVSLPGHARYFAVALLAGLVVDGLRFSAAHWWKRSRQLEHDLEDIFTSNLA